MENYRRSRPLADLTAIWPVPSTGNMRSPAASAAACGIRLRTHAAMPPGRKGILPARSPHSIDSNCTATPCLAGHQRGSTSSSSRSRSAPLAPEPCRPCRCARLGSLPAIVRSDDQNIAQRDGCLRALVIDPSGPAAEDLRDQDANLFDLLRRGILVSLVRHRQVAKSRTVRPAF